MEPENVSICLCPHNVMRGIFSGFRSLWSNGYIGVAVAVFAAKIIWNELQLSNQLRKDIDKFQDDIKEMTRENLETYKAIWREKRSAGGDKWDGGWDAGQVDMSNFMRPCRPSSRQNPASYRDNGTSRFSDQAGNACSGRHQQISRPGSQSCAERKTGRLSTMSGRARANSPCRINIYRTSKLARENDTDPQTSRWSREADLRPGSPKSKPRTPRTPKESCTQTSRDQSPCDTTPRERMSRCRSPRNRTPTPVRFTERGSPDYTRKAVEFSSSTRRNTKELSPWCDSGYTKNTFTEFST